MKILHITPDDPFIDYALSSFESVYPNQNTVFMLNSAEKINSTNNYFDESFSLSETFLPSFLRKLAGFDIVVLHSFIPQWYPLVLLAPRETKFAWIGWGFDYYDYVYNDSNSLLLKDTLTLNSSLNNHKKIQSSIKALIRYPYNKIIKSLALKRISSFSPVLREDYDLVANAKIIPYLPDFKPWNYGSLEEILIKNFIGQRIDGNSILVGNSATATNNHIEAFNLLSKLRSPNDVKVVTPLSYGDDCYRNEVIRIGNQILNNNFEPVTEYLPIDEYITLIKKCGYVIMNHIRQQAVGNIIIMLYLGARVFLREENPTYVMLKKEGAVLNTIQELESSPNLLNQPLPEEDILKNISVLYKNWSKEVVDNKTKNLVEFHLGDME